MKLAGYTAYTLTQKTGTKGGLISYILNDYTVKDLNLYVESKSWEGQFLEVQGNGLKSKLILNNLYVPPRSSNEFTEFTNAFLPIVNSLTNKYKHMITIGDTNADALQCNSSALFCDYFDNIMSNGLLPVITLPTHFGTRNGHIIDHIYVKSDIDQSELYAGILLHKFSKHLPVFTCLPLKNEIIELPKYVNITKNSPQNWDNLLNDFSSINWNNVMNTNNLFSNPSINYSKFADKIIDLKNKHLPSKKVRFKRYKHKNNSWITHGLLTSIKQKDLLYKKFHSLPTNNPNYETIKDQFKTYEKNLKNLIHFVKTDYYKRQFTRFKSDIKKTWQTIKTVLNKNRSARKYQTKFCVKGEIVEGDLKIANAFNKFFSEIGPTLASEIQTSNPSIQIQSFLLSNTNHTFSFNITTPDIVKNIIQNLKDKNSMGNDNLNSIFIKKIQNFIIQPLTILVNQSLLTGIFPDRLKIAKITYTTIQEK